MVYLNKTKIDIFILKCFCKEIKNSGNLAGVIIDFNGYDQEKLNIAKKISIPVIAFISNFKSNNPIIEFFYPNLKTEICLHGALSAAFIFFNLTGKNYVEFFTVYGRSLYIEKKENDFIQVKVLKKNIACNANVNIELVYKMLNLNNKKDIAFYLPLSKDSCDNKKLFIPVNSLNILSKLKPNYVMIEQWSKENKINGLYVYTNVTTSNFFARGFNPKTGYKEDAATGIAAAGLSLILKKSLTIEQGDYIKNPCLIRVKYVNNNFIFVGGKVKYYGIISLL